MAWSLRLDRTALRDLRKLDRQAARRIVAFLDRRVAPLSDPRSIGEALKGPVLGEYWKYRVGSYRVIARIEDKSLLILVIRIGNRRDVYRRLLRMLFQ